MLKSLFRIFPRLLLIMVITCVMGCTSSQKRYDPKYPVQPAKCSVDDLNPEITYAIDAYDPWEGFNRRAYRFNYYFDKYVFLPVTGAYSFIMPDFFENRIKDFFKNIGEFRTLTNSMLQLNQDKSATTFVRAFINTTLGCAGFFDIATDMGIARENEDFGQTLGHYGTGAGPYVVLPILGPSNLRDTTGTVVDSLARSLVVESIDPFENASEKDWIKAGIYALEAIDKRNSESFRYYETGSPFEYELIRMLYLEKRKLDIAN